MALLVVVLIAALVALDLGVRRVAQSALASSVRNSTHARRVSVDISSFPLLWDVAARGELDRLTVTGAGVPAGPLTLDSVRVEADSVHFDRSYLMFDHKARVTSVARAVISVTARLSNAGAGIASAVGAKLDIRSGHDLTLEVGGHTVVSYDLTRIPLIPDCPFGVRRSGDAYIFSCTVSPVPATVLVAISART